MNIIYEWPIIYQYYLSFNNLYGQRKYIVENVSLVSSEKQHIDVSYRSKVYKNYILSHSLLKKYEFEISYAQKSTCKKHLNVSTIKYKYN